MTWNTNEIRSAFEQGNTGEYSHMLVGFDDFDRENYPIYVPQGEDPRSHRPSNGDRVDECYSYRLSWASQAAEYRAQHWDYEPKPEPQPEIDPADSEVLGEAFDGIVLKEVQPVFLDGLNSGEVSTELDSIGRQRAEIQAAAELVVAQRAALLAEGWEQGAAAMRAYQIGEARAYDRGETEPSEEPQNPHRTPRS